MHHPICGRAQDQDGGRRVQLALVEVLHRVWFQPDVKEPAPKPENSPEPKLH